MANNQESHWINHIFLGFHRYFGTFILGSHLRHASHFSGYSLASKYSYLPADCMNDRKIAEEVSLSTGVQDDSMGDHGVGNGAGPPSRMRCNLSFVLEGNIEEGTRSRSFEKQLPHAIRKKVRKGGWSVLVPCLSPPGICPRRALTHIPPGQDQDL